MDYWLYDVWFPSNSPNETSGVGFTTTVPPTGDVVTLTEAKLDLIVEHALDDTLIQGMLNAAVRQVEQYIAQRLLTQQVRMTVERFPCGGYSIPLYGGPVQSVQSIMYGTTTMVLTTDYRLWLDHNPPLVRLPNGGSWPDPLGELITLSYTVGFGTASAVPDTIKSVIKLLVNHRYFNRGDATRTQMTDMPASAKALLDIEWCGRYR